MTRLAEIGARLDELIAKPPAPSDAAEFLSLGEQALEQWVLAKGKEPTREEREGFRLLALHRQGADKEPSFNACRETCRELVYHFNLLTLPTPDEQAEHYARMMALVANHLFLFVSGCAVVRLPLGESHPPQEVTLLGEGEAKVLMVDVSGMLSFRRPWAQIKLGFSRWT